MNFQKPKISTLKLIKNSKRHTNTIDKEKSYWKLNSEIFHLNI